MSYGKYRRSSTPQSKWMDAKYGGACKVCRGTILVGDRIYWDAAARTATCHGIDCCEADGLTATEWRGSPVSGGFVAVRAAKRIGSPYTADSNTPACRNCQQPHDDHRASDDACPLPKQQWAGRTWHGGYSETETYSRLEVI